MKAPLTRCRALCFCLTAAVLALLAWNCAAAQSRDPHQLFAEALTAQQQGDTALAVSKYEALIRIHPELTAAHANLAGVLVSLGRYDEAIAEYRTALGQAPGNRQLELALAIAYFRKGDFKTAGSEFASLHWEDPMNVRVATLLAQCDTHLGRDDQAIALLEPLESANSDNLDLAWALGTALINTGHTRQGLKRIQKVADQGRSVRAYQTAANLYLGLTYFDEARHDAEAVIQLNPRVPQAYIVLGMVKDYSGDQRGAVEEFEKALSLDPKNLQARIQLGSVLLTQRKLDQARQQFVRALAQDPTSSPAHYLLARVKRLQGNLPGALTNLESAERENPEWLAPHIDLAALYYALKRPGDGAREKKIVDQLMADERERHSTTRVILPRVPGR